MLAYAFLLLFPIIEAGGPVVSTRYGAVEGFRFETRSKKSADIFLNIPFAEAPVGELRFEKPRSPLPWDGVRNATVYGPTCYPHHEAAISPPASEDCLQLNIIRPSHKAPASGLPVLVWIHGGGYEVWSAVQHGYEGYANIYTPANIIVVTIQYRLGVLGFFSTGDDRMPGNLGFWDQAAAIRWIHENIAAFGGDPNQIIAWGLSAGAGSAGILSLSPHTRNLVSATIEHSGSVFAGYTLGTKVPQYSKELANYLGCDKDVKSCLKTKSVDTILNAVDKTGSSPNFVGLIKYGPRIDGDFIPYSIHRLVEEAPPKPALISMVKKEGTFFTTYQIAPMIHSFSVDVAKESKEWNREKLVEKIKTQLVNEEHFGKNTKQALEEIVHYYVDKDYEKGFGSDYFIDQYTKFIGDTVLNFAGLEGAEVRRNAGFPIYMYLLSHSNEGIYPKEFSKRMHGAPHCYDYPYIFETTIYPEFDVYSESEIAVTMAQQQNIIEFAKTGKPLFPDVGTDEGLHYLDVAAKPEFRKQGIHGDLLKFWRGIRRFGYDVASLTPIEAKTSKYAKTEL